MLSRKSVLQYSKPLRVQYLTLAQSEAVSGCSFFRLTTTGPVVCRQTVLAREVLNEMDLDSEGKAAQSPPTDLQCFPKSLSLPSRALELLLGIEGDVPERAREKTTVARLSLALQLAKIGLGGDLLTTLHLLGLRFSTVSLRAT